MRRHLLAHQPQPRVGQDELPGALPEQVACDQEGQRRAQCGADDDVEGALHHAKHKTRPGGKQHARQQQYHHGCHDEDKQQRRPGTLGIKPVQQRYHLLIHIEIDQQREQRRDEQDAGGHAPQG